MGLGYLLRSVRVEGQGDRGESLGRSLRCGRLGWRRIGKLLTVEGVWIERRERRRYQNGKVFCRSQQLT